MRTDGLIIGAGSAGLTLAALLAGYGVDFQILDSKSGPVEQSRAALVNVRTLELLDRLGLADSRRARSEDKPPSGYRAGERPRFRWRIEAQRLRRLTRSRSGSPEHQTEQLLLAHLAALDRTVTWRTTLIGSTVRPTQTTTATVRRSDRTNDTISARWVVGADGTSRPVRRALGIDFRQYLQSDRAAGRRGTRDTRRRPPSGGHAPPEPYGVGIFDLGNGRHRLFGAVAPGFTASGNDSEITHEAYAEVASADLQQRLNEYFAVDAQIRSTSWTAPSRIHSRIADHIRSCSAFLSAMPRISTARPVGRAWTLHIGDAFNLCWKLALVATRQAHEQLLDSYEASVPGGQDRAGEAATAFALENHTKPARTRSPRSACRAADGQDPRHRQQRGRLCPGCSAAGRCRPGETPASMARARPPQSANSTGLDAVTNSMYLRPKLAAMARPRSTRTLARYSA